MLSRGQDQTNETHLEECSWICKRTAIGRWILRSCCLTLTQPQHWTTRNGHTEHFTPKFRKDSIVVQETSGIHICAENITKTTLVPALHEDDRKALLEHGAIPPESSAKDRFCAMCPVKRGSPRLLPCCLCHNWCHILEEDKRATTNVQHRFVPFFLLFSLLFCFH